MNNAIQNKPAFFKKYAPAFIAGSSAFVAVMAGNPAFAQSIKLMIFGWWTKAKHLSYSGQVLALSLRSPLSVYVIKVQSNQHILC